VSGDGPDPRLVFALAVNQERDRIVAWLRDRSNATDDRRFYYLDAADRLERGEHLKDEPGRPGERG
jgi:hypothetical protein